MEQTFSAVSVTVGGATTQDPMDPRLVAVLTAHRLETKEMMRQEEDRARALAETARLFKAQLGMLADLLPAHTDPAASSARAGPSPPPPAPALVGFVRKTVVAFAASDSPPVELSPMSSMGGSVSRARSSVTELPASRYSIPTQSSEVPAVAPTGATKKKIILRSPSPDEARAAGVGSPPPAPTRGIIDSPPPPPHEQLPDTPARPLPVDLPHLPSVPQLAVTPVKSLPARYASPPSRGVDASAHETSGLVATPRQRTPRRTRASPMDRTVTPDHFGRLSRRTWNAGSPTPSEMVSNYDETPAVSSEPESDEDPLDATQQSLGPSLSLDARPADPRQADDLAGSLAELSSKASPMFAQQRGGSKPRAMSVGQVHRGASPHVAASTQGHSLPVTPAASPVKAILSPAREAPPPPLATPVRRRIFGSALGFVKHVLGDTLALETFDDEDYSAFVTTQPVAASMSTVAMELSVETRREVAEMRSRILSRCRGSQQPVDLDAWDRDVDAFCEAQIETASAYCQQRALDAERMASSGGPGFAILWQAG
jgi:hypothetical protein